MELSKTCSPNLLYAILLLPCAGAIGNAALAAWGLRQWAARLACAAAVATSACACWLTASMVALARQLTFALGHRSPLLTTTPWHWVDCGAVHLQLGLAAQPWTAAVACVLCAVAAATHVAAVVSGASARWPALGSVLDLGLAAAVLLVFADGLLPAMVGGVGLGLVNLWLLAAYASADAAAASVARHAAWLGIGEVSLVVAIMVVSRFLHETRFGGLAAAAGSGAITSYVAAAAAALWIWAVALRAWGALAMARTVWGAPIAVPTCMVMMGLVAGLYGLRLHALLGLVPVGGAVTAGLAGLVVLAAVASATALPATGADAPDAMWAEGRWRWATRAGAIMRSAGEAALVSPCRWICRHGLSQGIEHGLLAGATALARDGLRALGFGGQLVHNGNLQRYLALYALGLAAIWGLLGPGLRAWPAAGHIVGINP